MKKLISLMCFRLEYATAVWFLLKRKRKILTKCSNQDGSSQAGYLFEERLELPLLEEKRPRGCVIAVFRQWWE